MTTGMNATWTWEWIFLCLLFDVSACDHTSNNRSKGSDHELLSGSIDQMPQEELDQGEELGTLAGQSLAGSMGGSLEVADCLWPADCPEGDCQEGRCVEHAGLCQGHLDCPIGASCAEGRCIVSCVYDSNCATGGICVEGECMPSPPELLEGNPILGEAASGTLLVGYGVSDLEYPVGVSLAGFGVRPGPRTPYSKSLGGSDSVWERQDVRAVAIDSEGQVTLMIRLPLAWSTDYLRSLIALELRSLLEELGSPNVNPLNDLIVFATHSHSQPARFWNLAPQLNFGALGYGSFSQSLTQAYARSAARAALHALQNRKLAKIGWAILDEADPARLIHSNRRGHSNEIFDDRLLALRFDALDGGPIVALVGFAVHGTHLMSPLVSGDCAGVIEQVFTERLSAKFETETPAIFMNGNAGNISPRGDHVTSEDLGHLQALATMLWAQYEPLFDRVRWEESPVVRHKAWRIPIGYEVLGYDEDPPSFASSLGQPYHYGAFGCANDERGPDEMSYQPPDIPCAVVIHSIYHAPIMQFQKTVLSAFRLGSLLLSTMPGEPVSDLGLRLAELVEEDARRAGLVESRSFNIGYAQDHHFYLLRTDDWLHGGYESRMGLWGWREGEHLIQQSSVLHAHLLGLIDLPEYPLSPTWWPERLREEEIRTPSAQPNTEVLEQPNPSIRRDQLVQLRWRGGDPAVDRPKVSLWKLAPDNSETPSETPALQPVSGLPLTDQGLESVIHYEGDYEGEHLWSIRWDLPLELPTGRYRIQVEGQAGEAYRLDSTPFVLTGRGGLIVQGREDDPERLTLALSYAPSPSNDDGGSFTRRAPTGSLLRLLSPLAFDEESLTRSEGDLKRWRYLIGPPVLTMLTLSLYPANIPFNEEGRATEPPLKELTLQALRGECSLSIVSARDEQGTESHLTLQGRLCGLIEIERSALSIDGISAESGQQLVIHDSAGSWLVLNL